MSTYKKSNTVASSIEGDFEAGMARDLDAIAREGARRLLVSALDAEVTEFLGRQRYERQDGSSGYRNGYGKSRQVTGYLTACGEYLLGQGIRFSPSP